VHMPNVVAAYAAILLASFGEIAECAWIVSGNAIPIKEQCAEHLAAYPTSPLARDASRSDMRRSNDAWGGRR
jgi:hypothetical protein